MPQRAVLKIEQNPGPSLPLKNKGKTATGFLPRVGQVLKIALKPLLGFKPNIKVCNLGYQPQKKRDFDR